jgi:nanoRNase/pAp phosphatase (c-di-AMP/oligoRNAs hydrolase)
MRCSTRALYVLVTHVNPDGDAIGSRVGLGAI